ncbi:BatA domain-containing protein [Mucilaginibacter terrae]|uniref:Aerotolerance regulator N-terminal domain-containing protein n=1 Tax=Mucilaginibacter terrae TaxID=1955052 RepID=A0ABU3GYE3_9SPHI|nr:BatA domain-containing protein [Mucilaginibacter terrae]MDT3404621.1 hypothetical protein [Mucilaginibacter terrae]
MQFLTPIWLFGAAAIIIPVLIHLWNIRSGKVLKVGSVSLIDAASRKSSRSFKLLDIPLFILRCLLLIVLALLLAMPVLQKKMQAAKVKGWVLIPKETFTETYQKFKPTVDSLTKAGYEFHYFNSGFAKSDLKKVLLKPKDSLKTISPATFPNYWNLARELDTKTASTLPVYLFTPNQMQYFTGEKPQVALNLKWQTYTPADSVSTWIQDAWFTANGEIRVVQGTSKPLGTAYAYSNFKNDDKANSAYTINTTDGKAQISLTGNKQEPVTVSTDAQNILIYADNNSLDANYLEAALQAVIQFSQRPISIKTVANPAQIQANTEWLFWLSDKPVNKALAKNILVYEKGKATSVNSWMSNAGEFTPSLADDEKVGLFKAITATDIKAEPVWQDGFGKPVLALEQQNQTNIYHFYSRFNPAWNNLVWSSNFPAWMLKLMVKPEVDNSVYDKRVLSAKQYMPVIGSEQHTVAAEKSIENKSLSRYFWLTLIIIFAAERWLAHRKPKTEIA